MRALVVKTSSFGDVLHTLPAINDAHRLLDDVRFDWVVEESLTPIATWHPAVDRVIPVATRRWRGAPWRAFRSGEVRGFMHDLKARDYDLIIDAQGLIKSAIIARLARGTRWGFGRASARESLAALAYTRHFDADRRIHAVARLRALFAASFGYLPPTGTPDFGVVLSAAVTARAPAGRYLLFAHATTWATKLWPEAHWVQLTELACASGYEVYLPWGNIVERRRAERIAACSDKAHLLPRRDLDALAATVATAQLVVGVDTGVAHLAAALGTPTVTLYGATDPERTGTCGALATRLQADFSCAPCLRRDCGYRGPQALQPACMATLAPEAVWATTRSHLPQVSRAVNE